MTKQEIKKFLNTILSDKKVISITPILLYKQHDVTSQSELLELNEDILYFGKVLYYRDDTGSLGLEDFQLFDYTGVNKVTIKCADYFAKNAHFEMDNYLLKRVRFNGDAGSTQAYYGVFSGYKILIR